MSKHHAQPVQLASGTSGIIGNINWAALGGDPLGELQVFAGMPSPEALQPRLREEIGEEIAAMLDVTGEFDAFDVIELMRLREIPVAPVVALDADFDGIAAAIDLVSLVCLSRPGRMPRGGARESTEPHRAIDDLHARATRLLRLAQIMHGASATLAADDPLARLASEYQSYLVGVRNLRYDSVEAEHDTALFGRPDISPLLRQHLGFTFGEFTAVRSAIQERYSRILTNTFLMSTGGRRSELVLLHKTGAIRRQVVWIIAAESMVLTLIGIAASAVVSGLVLGSLYVALTGEIGFVSVTLPWPLVGAILAGCVVIAILTSTLPAWFQLRPRRRPSGSIQG